MHNRHDKRHPVEARLYFHTVSPLLLLLGQAYLSSSCGSDTVAVNEGVLLVAGVVRCGRCVGTLLPRWAMLKCFFHHSSVAGEDGFVVGGL